MCRIGRSHRHPERIGSGLQEFEIELAVLCRTCRCCPHSELLHGGGLLAGLVSEHHHRIFGIRLQTGHSARQTAFINKVQDAPCAVIFHQMGIYLLVRHARHEL